MSKEKEYRVNVEYIGTTAWYNPQIKRRFLFWNYWDSIGNLYRYYHDAEEKIDEYIKMIQTPLKPKLYNPTR